MKKMQTGKIDLQYVVDNIEGSYKARRPKEKWANNPNNLFTGKGIIYSNKCASPLIR